jgi:tetratricopeptide (TPR) repeat protein
MPQQKLTVMISSTARDLPEHRHELVEACLRQDAFPLRMEDLPANSEVAATASLKLVEGSDVYIGVFANRYGYVPKQNNPDQISITEMEYNRATERKIERLIFFMDKSHPTTLDDVEIQNAAKLKMFKERVLTENIVRFFKSAADLRAEVINSLSKLRRPDLTAFHHIRDIPAPPEPFIAHPYTLLQTHKLVGRQSELNFLTDWVAQRGSEACKAHLLNIVAIGGIGKSALTWKWFNDIAPIAMVPLAGRMWWSFYESDATFENFITRALAYVTGAKLDQVETIPASEREAQLLTSLDRHPFLIVLDGLERILVAYARMDAAHLSDDDYDKRIANTFGNAIAMPANAAQSLASEHRLRKTADPRAGNFLRKLANTQSTRILVSTRLYPADLQTMMGVPLRSCAAKFLPGLSDDDAVDLWRGFGVTGATETLLPIFYRTGNHPLLLQALASEVARYRRAPGDLSSWLRDHLDFDPFSLPLVQVKSHVLEFALRGLDNRSKRVLEVVAAFRMPARYDTLAALLIGKRRFVRSLLTPRTEPCADQIELDQILSDLEDRGLVGWDKHANRYDVHPIVRGVVWSGLGEDSKRRVHVRLHAHFEALSKVEQNRVDSPKRAPLNKYTEPLTKIDHLTPTIELYSTLIGLRRYQDALELFQMCATHERLHGILRRVELLEMLFLEGLDRLPHVNAPGDQAYTLNGLATGYSLSGQPGRAAAMYRRAITIYREMTPISRLYGISGRALQNVIEGWLSIALINLSCALQTSGSLWDSQVSALRALVITTKRDHPNLEAFNLSCIGLALAARGFGSELESVLKRAMGMFVESGPLESSWKGHLNASSAQRAIWLCEFSVAKSFADHAWKLAHVQNYDRDLINAARLQGQAALGMADLVTANERLLHVCKCARMVNLVEEELPALLGLAQLRRRQGELKAAREFLDDVWEAAARGPYPLFHANAFNELAQIERYDGNTEAAVEAATNSYRLAWCDGPPFAYHWELEKAKKHLKELGASEPEMQPLDRWKFERMPKVKIDPLDRLC